MVFLGLTVEKFLFYSLSGPIPVENLQISLKYPAKTFRELNLFFYQIMFKNGHSLNPPTLQVFKIEDGKGKKNFINCHNKVKSTCV